MNYRHCLCLYPYTEGPNPLISLFPPTGLEYIATALKGHVDRISLVDLRHEPQFHRPEAMSEFIRTDVDLVCISLYWTMRAREVCNYISRLPPERTIVVGGHEATGNVEGVFERCSNVAAVIRGEGEETIQELADGRPWEQIQGLSFRRNGKIIHNPNRPLRPIDTITPPDRSLRRTRCFPSLRGIRLWAEEYDTVLASRGCPYNCRFCTLTINPLGQKRNYATRSPESVVDEIEASPARMILFCDDNFFVRPGHVEQICDLLLARRINKRYFANARIEVARYPDMLQKAYRAGFRMLLMGIESPTDRVLEQFNKGFTTSRVREAFRVLRRLPFFYHGYFIYGSLGETEEEMLRIPAYARELGLHTIALSLLHVDRFSPLREVVQTTPGYWLGSRGHVYSERYGKRGLLRIRNRIRRNFLFHPGQLAKTVSQAHSCEILTYRDMTRLAPLLPLIAWEYLRRKLRLPWNRPSRG